MPKTFKLQGIKPEREYVISEREMRRRLWEFVKQNYDTQTEAAPVLGVSPQMLSDMIHGQRRLSKPILEMFGMRKERVYVYAKVKEDDPRVRQINKKGEHL